MTQPAAGRPFDMRLIQRGARLRRSPYFEAAQRYGCRAYTVYNHMFLPSYYDDPIAEYWQLRVPGDVPGRHPRGGDADGVVRRGRI